MNVYMYIQSHSPVSTDAITVQAVSQ